MNAKQEEIVEGSGNVFADLGLPDAPELLLKAELTRQLHHRIEELGLTQAEAGRKLGLAQPDVSKLMKGKFTGFTADRLIGLFNALEMDVDIVLRPGAAPGRGTVRVFEANTQSAAGSGA